MKLKRIEKTINSKEEIHNITYDENLKPRIPPGRRRGRPKDKWAKKGTEEYWDSIRENWKHTDDNYTTNWKKYDPTNEKQNEFMRQYASAAIPVPEEIRKKIQNTQPIWKEWKEGEEWVEEWINSGESWNVYIREPETPKEKPRPTKTIYRTNFSRQRNEVHIPRPSYGYGAKVRSKFAFGKEAQEKAKKNREDKKLTEQEENVDPKEAQDEIEIEEDYPQPNEQTDQEEEDPFQFNETPNSNECA